MQLKFPLHLPSGGLTREKHSHNKDGSGQESLVIAPDCNSAMVQILLNLHVSGLYP